MTKKLTIDVRQNERTLTFSGDTFYFKDQIKSLGRSSWNSVDKSWVVKDFSQPATTLARLFPDAIVNLVDVSEVKPLDLSTLNSENSVNKNLELASSSVSALFLRIKQAISERVAGRIKVYGVLSSYKKISNGRIYFDLLDTITIGTSVRCVIWENKTHLFDALKNSGIELEDNLPVLVEASIAFNSKNGQVSLNIEGFVPEYTLGKLQAIREKTNEQLKKEGIFYNNQKLTLPFLPIRLGLLTSDAGTVINDFKASLEVCGFGFKLFWYPTRVQGEHAEKDLLSGLNYFQKNFDVDAILVFRGGGSVTELSVFSSYNLAKAVCESTTPIFSAIGHEFDQSSVQDVSFKSFGVPKDIGRYFSDLIIERREDLNDLGVNIIYLSNEILARIERNLSVATYKIFKDIQFIFDTKIKELEKISRLIQKQGVLRMQVASSELIRSANQMKSIFGINILRAQDLLRRRTNALINLFSKEYETNTFKLSKFHELVKSAFKVNESIGLKLEYMEGIIRSSSPRVQLERGFAIIRDSKTNVPIVSAKSLANEKEAVIEMFDGLADIKINNYREKQNEE